MNRIRLSLYMVGIFSVLITGCNNGQNPQKSEVTPESSAEAQHQQLRKELDSQIDKDLIEKVRKEDRLPPRVNAQIEVISNNQISMTDVEHSWQFSKASFERCYSIALARDENATGDVVLKLERKPGAAKPEVVSLTSEIQVEKFEDCIRAALPRWPVPEGADFEVRVKLRSMPGLTGEDFEKLSEHRKHDHHDHHDQTNDN